MRRYIVILLTCIFGISLLAEGGGKVSDSFLVSSWTIENGLPQNSVLSLIQTSDGYIWFGTQSGLVRFDGASVRVYNRWNTAALKNDRILSLFEDKYGGLWIGTDGGGVCLKKGEKWTVFTMDQGLTHNTVRAIAGGDDGFLWIGTDNGLNRFKNGQIEPYTLDDGLSGPTITALCMGRDNTLWIGAATGGVNGLKADKFRVIPVHAGDGNETANAGPVTVLREDSAGVLWAGMEKGVFRLAKEGLVRAGGSSPVQSVSAMLHDRSGKIWIGTEGEGFYRYESKRFKRVVTRQQLPDYFIYSLLEDREGNIWLGTYTAGLIRLKPALVSTIGPERGLPGNRVQAVLQDQSGRLWAGLEREGVCIITGDRVSGRITAADGLSGNRVRCLRMDRDGTAWIGTESGLNRWRDGKIRVYTKADGLSGDAVSAIFRDGSGIMWVGARNGLNRRSPTDRSFEIYNRRSGLSNPYVRVITQDRRGRLLVGTRGGLFVLNEKTGRFKQMGDIRCDVQAIYEQSKGGLWLGTNGSGLIRVEESGDGKRVRFHFYTTAEGLPNNYIFSINEDSSGRLWMSSYRGIFFTGADIPLPGSGPLTTVLLDEKEGMAAAECSSAGLPSAWSSKEGKIYVATVKGIAVVEPKALTRLPPAPPAVIESVIADNRTIGPVKETRGEIVLPTETQVVEFYFTALSFASPTKTRFRYMLEGYDRTWKSVAARRQRTALYLNLPPGSYRFRVMAGGNGGNWDSGEAVFRFRVKGGFAGGMLVYVLLGVILGVVIMTSVWVLRRARLTGRRRTGERGENIPAVEALVEEKYKTSALQPETVDAVLPELTRLMEEDRVFLDPELSLKHLAQRLNVHYNYLSRIINQQLGQSFNDYINSFRIEEARKRLCDPAHSAKTVLEIAYDTGFYSKSVFNTAFKKFTGLTPSQYKKECKE